MSRIGQKPILLESGITVANVKGSILVEGPAGKIGIILPDGIETVNSGNQLQVNIKNAERNDIQGLYRSLLQNAVIGVKKPWTKTLELVGVGYRAQTTGKELILNLGFSHPVKILAPEGITFAVAENKITVSGVDKYLVGEVAAEIRRIKKPEPYKGKGIRYQGEFIRKKLGKAAKAVGAAGAK